MNAVSMPTIQRPDARPVNSTPSIAPNALVSLTSRQIAAPLDATERKVVISVGAAWKTSGHQKCSGAADSLNRMPAIVAAMPRARMGVKSVAAVAAMMPKSNEPVTV